MIKDDQYRLKREKLAQSLYDKGIRDENVLAAIARIPRELFIDTSFHSSSYEDTALPIECSQTISQPYTVAFMTELLQVRPGDKVLEIGTGSGYQAMVLALMGAKVFTIERHRELHESASALFEKFGLEIISRHGDGTRGMPDLVPFDKIIVTAAAEDMPIGLIRQLKTGGLMAVPVGGREGQVMKLITRVSADEYTEKDMGGFKFVPLIADTDRP